MKDVAVGMLIGAALGGGIGYADPAIGYRSAALIGAVSGGAGDLIGQVAAIEDDPCHKFNKAEFIGAIGGGAVGGVAGQLFESVGSGLGSGWYSNFLGNLVGGQIGLLSGFLGSQVGNINETESFMGIQAGQ